jgi:hypothetical protein
MINIEISKSKNKNKKYDALINQNNKKKTLSFGQNNASDFTINKSEERKKLYIARHQKNEIWNFNNKITPGGLSKNLLWNKTTLKNSINDINNKFKNINISMK